ncbi:universal stress protein [Streptomyces antibioticus]|uniref:universal stress protein n=1 Tax=Streptomyces antibioticus TaxID=1890 RepID=UPI002257FA89|nr:universal stress protein [Streptomyces antibioticus]MCX5173883.1 universal stress protein [Streptomyces antibioticus]
MPSIVVGIDGSPASVRALHWAVEEARLRGATVRVVHAWSFPYHSGEIAHLAAESVHELLRKAAEETVETALHGVTDADRAVIECVIVQAPPVQALLDAARDASLLVVGSRGRGGFANLLLGSVSYQCVLHAPCPVVIVRG